MEPDRTARTDEGVNLRSAMTSMIIMSPIALFHCNSGGDTPFIFSCSICRASLDKVDSITRPVLIHITSTPCGMAPKNKRNKLKKMLSPPQSSPPDNGVDDDALMDDLLAQLDSQNEVVKQESATVLQEMQVKQTADRLDSVPKKDSQARYKARQVRLHASRASVHFMICVNRPAKQLRLRRVMHRQIPRQTQDSNGRRKRRKRASSGCVRNLG